MDLGKTVTSLACVVNGKPNPKDMIGDTDSPRATLIVVPAALISQWVAEIEKHTISADRKHRWGINSFMVYRESEGHIRKDSDFHAHDIILTTYGEVAKSWPVVDVRKKPRILKRSHRRLTFI